MSETVRRLRKALEKTEALQYYPSLKLAYGELQEQNSQLERKVKNRDSVISEQKKIQMDFAGKPSTLGDVVTYVQKTYQHEIQRGVNEKFNAEKDQLTLNRLDRLLNGPYEEMGEALQARLSIDIQNGVNKQLNDIFWKRVREGVREAKEKEWNPHLNRYLRDTITPICNTIPIERWISELTNRNIFLTCKRCNVQQSFRLTQQNIIELLQKKVTTFFCSTPNCIEGIINQHSTYIHLSLAEAFLVLVGAPTMPSENARTGTARGLPTSGELPFEGRKFV